MTNWEPERRDQELRHISNVTKGVAAFAVGGTVLLGVGIAWGDQQRVVQADNREAEQQAQPTAEEQAQPTSTIQPPANKPTPAQSTSKPKSKSGGS